MRLKTINYHHGINSFLDIAKRSSRSHPVLVTNYVSNFSYTFYKHVWLESVWPD